MIKKVELNFASKTQDRVEKTFIRKIVNHILKRIILPEGMISLTFISDQDMQVLNFTYRQKPKTTDVLTFNLYEDDQTLIDPLTHQPINQFISDIYISKAEVVKNSKRYKVSYLQELARVIAHAFAHTIGYDHMRPKELKVMREYENFLLLGYKL